MLLPTRESSFRLFRFLDIEVYVHSGWILVAIGMLIYRAQYYHSLFWNVLEYLALFGIVLVHEFGHALACRQVGGKSDHIILWFLGGVAYGNAPQRPGATLWTVAAGPLVNVVLFPILSCVVYFSECQNWIQTLPDLDHFLLNLWKINGVLLLFNLLPVYPLDGGQLFRSLLWFVVGRARSLMIATTVGLIGVVGFMGLALWQHSIWLGIIAVFALLNCWGALTHARMLARAENAPRRAGFACPGCQAAPPQGNFGMCGKCRKAFDGFDTNATCPYCGTQFGATGCMECGEMFPIYQWIRSAPVAPPIMVSTVPPPLRPTA